jgi:hypothetical protein
MLLLVETIRLQISVWNVVHDGEALTQDQRCHRPSQDNH